MSGSNVECRWMYVEGDEEARCEGEGTGVGLMDGDKQKKWKVGDEVMNKYDWPRDGGSGTEADKNLVGEVITKDGKGENVDESVVSETKAEEKDEINVDTTDQTNQVEDIPCDKQTDISEEHFSGADVIPADKSMQSENGKYVDRTDKKK